jgi:hypothetical protein
MDYLSLKRLTHALNPLTKKANSGVCLSVALRIALIILVGASYVLIHETGHYLIAESYGLHPSFVYSGANSGLLGLALGVSHLPATAEQQMAIIFGATILPMLLVVMLIGSAHFTGSEAAALAAEVYLLLIVVNLIPIPGIGQLDANKVWAAVLPP